MRVLLLLLLPLTLAGAAKPDIAVQKDSSSVFGELKTVDANATKKTKALYANLREISSRHIL
ncbi:MAG: hypothetical protein KDD06_02035, partial [Phaeodactylibacter sp.]|nr:hypothetical protein [Phaeodactylibacter sp.]